MRLRKRINKSFWEYLAYFLAATFAAYFFYLSKGIHGWEHLLSTWQVFSGLTPFIDFFEHHGPLQYYLFAPLFYLGGYNFFPFWMIIINSLICVLFIRYFFWNFSFGIRGRLILAAVLIWLWTVMFGGVFLPEPYVACLVILIYLFFSKIRAEAQSRTNNIYLAIFGILFGALFLIKFNAFVLLSFGLCLYCLFNFKKERSLINLKNISLFAAGMIAPLLPFLFIYHDKLRQVAYLMFTYNFGVVSRLARAWPPQPFSLFFLILSVDIIVLSAIFFNKENREKYYKLTFPILSSLCLLLMSYPLYGNFHLLPAMVGFLTGILLFFKEKIYRRFAVQVSDYKKYVASALVLLVISYVFLTFANFVFSLGKETYRIFWVRPEEFYHSDFAPGAAAYIEEQERCEYVYVYPADQYNLPMYIELPDVKRIRFAYPNWNWTFTEDMQEMIVAELEDKRVDCLLVADKPMETTLHSQIIEDYVRDNYSKVGEVTWRIYSFKNLLPFKFITDYKKNGQDFTYSLFKINSR
ncbi:MAG: hypothetical protein WC719_00135 [Patescibacteria group bacterium]|jgi:hypothetical protein